MKRFLLLFVAVPMFIGCSKYDDLRNDMDDLKKRVESLEKICNLMNSNISSLQSIVSALQSKDYVTSVSPLVSGGKTIGYIIKFDKSGTITIYDGKDGATPVISVKTDTDGKYYWTLDGEWLKDEQGNKISATGADGEPGITPQFKIENGYWYVSYDIAHTKWTILGKATGENGDSMFNSVTQDKDNVYFQLATGETITIPMKKDGFIVKLDKTEILLMEPGEKTTVGYTIEEANSNIIVRALGQNGWTAVVRAVDDSSGTIEITAPAPLVQGEILVFVSDGKSQTVMAAIDCSQGTITFADNSFDIIAYGGVQEVVVTTNLEYSVDIPADAQNWISIADTRAAVREETLTFIIAPYNETAERFATVSIKNNEGVTLQTIIFRQAGDTRPEQKHIVLSEGSVWSTLSKWDLKTIVSLKVSGSLNVNSLGIFDQNRFPALKELDLSEVKLQGSTKLSTQTFYRSTVEVVSLPESLTEIGEEAFAESKLTRIKLPGNITKIGEGAFRDCSILGGITIPASVETIGDLAFYKCGNLASVFFEPGCALTTIGGCSFEETRLHCVTIPARVTTIGYRAFADNYALSTVKFEPNSSLTVLSNGIFARTGIQSITIPASVIELGGAFYFCNGLHTIQFEKGSKLQSIGLCSSAANGAEALGSLQRITIPSSVQTIKPGSFFGFEQLSEVIFEENSQLKTIGDKAFGQCTKLPSFDASNCKSIESIGSGVFKNCYGINMYKIGTVTPPQCSADTFPYYFLTLKVPIEAVESYKSAQYWNSFYSITALDE